MSNIKQKELEYFKPLVGKLFKVRDPDDGWVVYLLVNAKANEHEANEHGAGGGGGNTVILTWLGDNTVYDRYWSSIRMFETYWFPVE